MKSRMWTGSGGGTVGRREFLRGAVALGAGLAAAVAADRIKAEAPPVATPAADAGKGALTMTKQIERLRWRQAWVSHLGCIEGCLDRLGVSITRPWLYGGTGHAFVINMHETVCPSGPTAWSGEMLVTLAPNLGYKVTSLMAEKTQPDFAAKQEEAWKFVRKCVDAGTPCYGWELEWPDYAVIFGYDDAGYYFSGPGCDAGKGPKPWKQLGVSDIGMLYVASVERCKPAADVKVVKDALTAAVKFAENPGEWVFPKYRSGPAAFDVWAKALEDGTAGRFGHGYNAAVWAECREVAVAFLEEARKRLPGKADAAFDEAMGHYKVIRDKLRAVAEMHPFRTVIEVPVTETFKSPEAAKLVREAGAAERKGLEALKKIAVAL